MIWWNKSTVIYLSFFIVYSFFFIVILSKCELNFLLVFKGINKKLNSMIVGYKFCNVMYPFFSCTSERRDIPLLTHTYMRICCGCFCWKCRFVCAIFLWASHVCLLVGLFLLWYLFLQCAVLSHLNFSFGWYCVFINTAALLREFSIILSCFVSKECLHFRWTLWDVC